MIFASIGGTSAVFAQEESKTEPEQKYSVHEWGVFTVPRGADWLKQDMLAEWQGFPEFFHGTLPNRKLAYRGPVTKPVIFFHGEEKFRVSLMIQFADGQPLIWWPPVDHPATGSFGVQLPAEWKDVHPDSVLRYSLTLNETGRTELVPDDHWVNDLRKVKAAPIMVYDSHSNFRSLDEHQISEPFVYYDGLMKPPAVPQVTRTKDGIQLTSNSDHDWLDVLVIDRSLDGDQVSVGQLERLEQGSRTTAIPLQRIEPESLDELISDFKQSLVEPGLHVDEAQSLLDVWSEGLFRRPGLTLLYRIPQATYDTWIPLLFDPQPESVVRIGLVVHQHLEPELHDSVARLISDLGSDDYRVRMNADRQLHSIGGAALPEIRKIANSDDRETAARARQLIRNLDTDKLLEQVMTRYRKQKDK